jgi:hypothetical protein
MKYAGRLSNSTCACVCIDIPKTTLAHSIRYNATSLNIRYPYTVCVKRINYVLMMKSFFCDIDLRNSVIVYVLLLHKVQLDHC